MKIKYHQRAMHQTLQFLVISLFFISCSTLKQDIEQDKKIIIEKEIYRLLPFFKDETVYLDFNLNNNIKFYLEENKQNSNPHLKDYYLNNRLSDEDIKLIFNEQEVDYLVKQLQQNKFNIYKLDLSKNIILNDTQKEKENIKGNGLKSANYYTNKRIFLSIPVILKKGNYAIIAYSSGSIDSSSGGFRIYKRVNKERVFYEVITSWIS